MKKALVLLVAVSMTPLSALAQQGAPAGKVWVKEGQVDARRPTAPSPVKLNENDPVFLRDTIVTGADSLTKMVMGGKAVVTVRELSFLTITQEQSTTRIEMPANPPRGGKVSIHLIKKEMKPGDNIEVRTPNAIASVRGSLVVVETNGAGNLTEVDNFDGTDVRAAVPSAPAATLQIPAGMGVTVTNVLGPLRPLRPNVMVGLLAKGKAGRGQKATNPNVGTDLSALGGDGGSNLLGAGGPYPPILPGNSRGGYISKP